MVWFVGELSVSLSQQMVAISGWFVAVPLVIGYVVFTSMFQVMNIGAAFKSAFVVASERWLQGGAAALCLCSTLVMWHCILNGLFNGLLDQLPLQDGHLDDRMEWSAMLFSGATYLAICADVAHAVTGASVRVHTVLQTAAIPLMFAVSYEFACPLMITASVVLGTSLCIMHLSEMKKLEGDVRFALGGDIELRTKLVVRVIWLAFITHAAVLTLAATTNESRVIGAVVVILFGSIVAILTIADSLSMRASFINQQVPLAARNSPAKVKAI